MIAGGHQLSSGLPIENESPKMEQIQENWLLLSPSAVNSSSPKFALAGLYRNKIILS